MAKWIHASDKGYERLINFDKVQIIFKSHSGKAILEWDEGQQVTIDEPTFQELVNILTEGEHIAKFSKTHKT